MSQRERVLIFCDYFLPSKKSGGGMWTLVNMIEQFANQYDFYLVARNYDSKSDRTPFTTVKTNAWNDLGNVRVFFAPADEISIAKAVERVEEIQPGVVFLNSAFSTPTIKFLTARRLGRVSSELPVILAPCGELHSASLQLKRMKKKSFLAAARFAKLYKGIIWKATNEEESAEIARVFGETCVRLMAPDLTPKSILPDFSMADKPIKTPGSARLLFLSRIVRKKNLDFLLRILSKFQNGLVELTIAGPVEDRAYWSECEAHFSTLPSNVRLDVVGPVTYDVGLKLLCDHHFFILPTITENFAYVVFEALSAGCPPILSENTIWSEIETRNAGRIVQLSDELLWFRTIQELVSMDQNKYAWISRAARLYAEEYLAKSDDRDALEEIFRYAFAASAVPSGKAPNVIF